MQRTSFLSKMSLKSYLYNYVLMLMVAGVQLSVCDGGSGASSLWHVTNNAVGDTLDLLNQMADRSSDYVMSHQQNPLRWSVLQPDLTEAGAPASVAGHTDGAISEALTHLGDWYSESHSQEGEVEPEYMHSPLTYYHPFPSLGFYIHVDIMPLQLMPVQDVYFECTQMLQLMYDKYPHGKFPRGKVTVQLNKVRIFYAIKRTMPQSHSPEKNLRWKVLPLDLVAPPIVTANIDAAITRALIKLDDWYRVVTRRAGRIKSAYMNRSRSYIMPFPFQGFFIQVIISPLHFPMAAQDVHTACTEMLVLMYKDYPPSQFPFGKVDVEFKKVQISYVVKKYLKEKQD